MKKLFFWCLSIVVLSAGCKKSHVTMPDGGCINLATPKYVTGADSVAATLLFKNNNIDYSTLRYHVSY